MLRNLNHATLLKCSGFAAARVCNFSTGPAHPFLVEALKISHWQLNPESLTKVYEFKDPKIASRFQAQGSSTTREIASQSADASAGALSRTNMLY